MSRAIIQLTPDEKRDMLRKRRARNILRAADATVEGNNFHDRVGLGFDLYDAIVPLVPDVANHVRLARIIAEIVTDL